MIRRNYVALSRYILPNVQLCSRHDDSWLNSVDDGWRQRLTHWTHGVLVNTSQRTTRATIYRLSLSPMTECQIKRRHSVTSLATTLANVQFAQSKIAWTSLGTCSWSACVRTCSAKLLRYIHCESKTSGYNLAHDLLKCWPIFKIVFTERFSSKFARKLSLTIPSHLKHVAILPCETLISEN